jgi:hypothetical protein
MCITFSFLISRSGRLPLPNTCLRADVCYGGAPSGRLERRLGSRAEPFGHPRIDSNRSGSGPLRALNIIFNKENYISFFSSPRDRALVFSPRAPFAFVPAIPKTANKNAGGAEGGFQGGIPPRPPFGIRLSPFSDDFQFSAKLCGFLNNVRTFFQQNPE